VHPTEGRFPSFSIKHRKLSEAKLTGGMQTPGTCCYLVCQHSESGLVAKLEAGTACPLVASEAEDMHVSWALQGLPGGQDFQEYGLPL
jgi:hypothetical protein